MKIRLRVRESPREGFDWEHAGPTMCIGRGDDCQLVFRGNIAEIVSARHVQIDLSPKGVLVSDLGSTNGTYLNGARLTAPTQLRVGDGVQLGLAGPRLEVLAIDLQAGTGPTASRGSPAGGRTLVAAGAPAKSAKAVALPTSTDGNARHDAAPISLHRLPWVVPAALALGSLVVVFVLYSIMRQPGRLPDPKLEPIVPAVATSRTQSPVEMPTDGATAVSPHEGETPPDSPVAATPAAADQSGTPATENTPSAPGSTNKHDAIDDAVLLLLVEEPKTGATWPFGTASAVADRSLLTSATVATGLAGFRDRGWKLWAFNQRLGLKLPVTDLRVHAGFVRAQGKPDRQIYADFALLTVDATLPKQIEMASAEELADLDRGLPIVCRGYLYENEPLGRFQTFLPEPYAGKVFVMTSLPPSPGGPRLIHFRADLPGKLYGAPVVNAAGHLLGVFSETAAPKQPGADLHLHYAPVVDHVQIDRWIKDQDEQWWVPPAAQPSSP